MKKNSRKIRTSLILLLFFLPAATAAGDEKILSVEVRGNVRVPTSVILREIKTKEGQDLSSERLREDVRRLYDTGDFQDIKTEKKQEPGGIALIFHVKEKYTISKIEFSGNKALRDRKLRRKLTLSEGSLFDSKKLKEEKERIASIYREAGFAKVRVTPEVDEMEEERKVVINFKIEEGISARVVRVSIEGNNAFSDSKIRKQIKTGRGFFRRRLYREDILNEDKQRILSFYRHHGYIKAQIVETKLDYDEKGKKVHPTLYIDEGPKYIVGTVMLKEELRKEVELDEGVPFSPEELRIDIRRVYDYLYERGHVYASVNARKKVDEENKKVDIIYSVNEGEIAYIEEIEISGNVRTRDKIIRREILIKPGDRFDLNKIRGSQRKIRNLGRRQPFFDSVTFKIKDGSARDRKKLHYKVTEGKTGTFLFGGGYSSIDRFIGFVEVDIENFDITNPPAFGGGGQSVTLHGEIGTEKTNYLLSFTEPWLFDKPLSSGFDLYDRRREWETYEEDRGGGRLRFGHPLGEFNSIHTRYKYEDVEISHFSSDASEEIKREEGTNATSSLSLILARDTRDNFFNPRRGGRSSISTELAGDFLGGDRDFTKHIAKTSWFFPIGWRESSINLRMELARVEEFGDSEYVPIYERFYTGGADSVRGYAYRDIGPKDETGDPIGGKIKTVATVEYTIPIVKDLKGAIFCDVGNVWTSSDDFDLGGLYTGIGAGIRLGTPMGPLRLDYGYGIDISHARIHFTMGWPF